MRVLVALISAAVLATGAAGAIARATVSVPQTTPFTVKATGFRPLEKVKVTVFYKGAHSRTIIAGNRGAFAAIFPAVNVGTCGTYSVKATGNHGSKATFKRVRPRCA
jgi:hypothetical protein